MFGFLRSRIPFLARRAGPPAPEVVLLHRAKVRSPRTLVFKRFATGLVACYIAGSVWHDAILLPYLDRISSALDEAMPLSEEEKRELEEGWKLFIPVPLMFRVLQQPPYKVTDPEWRAFLDLHRNRAARYPKMHSQLKDHVHAIFEFSQVPFKYGRVVSVREYSWHLIFPQYPPRQIVQCGWTWEGLRYRPVDYMTFYRHQRILVPWAMAKSTYAFAHTLTTQTINDARVAVGYPPQPPKLIPPLSDANNPKEEPVGEQQGRKNAQTSRAMAAAKDGRGGSVPSPPGDAGSGGGTPTETQEQHQQGKSDGRRHQQEQRQQKQEPQKAQQRRGGGTDTVSDKPAAPPPPSTPGEADPPAAAPQNTRSLPFPQEYLLEKGSRPFAAFWETMKQNWRRPVTPPPRGSLNVLAQYMVETARGTRMIVDVEAHYDPRTGKFDDSSMQIRIRNILIVGIKSANGG